MNRTQWARLLRYLATPFIMLAIGMTFYPARWPGWVCTSCLVINSGLLLISLWLRPSGSKY